MAAKDIIKHQFEKGVSGNPNGRPKRFITSLKQQGYKLNEVVDTMKVLLSCTERELKEVADDAHTTILEKTVALALLEGLKRKSLFNIDLILNRAIGKPRETQEIRADVNVKAFKVHVVKVDTPFANSEADIVDGMAEDEGE